MARASAPPPFPPDPGCLVADKAMSMEELAHLLPRVDSQLFHPNYMATPAASGPFALRSREAPVRVVTCGLGTMPYRWAPRFRLAALLLHGTFPDAVLRPYVASMEEELGCVGASADLRQKQVCPPTESREKGHVPTNPFGSSDVRSAYSDTGIEPLLTDNGGTRTWSTVSSQQPGHIMSTQEDQDSMNGDISIEDDLPTYPSDPSYVRSSNFHPERDIEPLLTGNCATRNCSTTGNHQPGHIVSTQEDQDSMNGDISINVPTGADNSSKKIKHQPTQFFVMHSGHTISVQQDTSVMTVQRLVDRVCQMKEQRNHDCYAVYGGKRLDGSQTLPYLQGFYGRNQDKGERRKETNS